MRRHLFVVFLVAATSCHHAKTEPAFQPASIGVGHVEREPEEEGEGECGTERRAIKLGYDDAAKHVDVDHAQTITIDALRALLPPAHVKTSPRTPPTETTVFRLDSVTLRWYMRETDGDYHIVIADEHGDTMIAEIPAPDCIHKSSPWRDFIGKARAAIEARLHHLTSRRNRRGRRSASSVWASST